MLSSSLNKKVMTKLGIEDTANVNIAQQYNNEVIHKTDEVVKTAGVDVELSNRGTRSQATAMMESIRERHSVQPINLSLKNITYAPVTKSYRFKKMNETRQIILDNVSVEIHPFKLQAWMGPSGAGKSR